MSPQAPLDTIFAPGEPRRWLQEKLLPDYVRGSRWFGGKARDPRLFEVIELLSLPGAPETTRLALLRVAYADGGSDLYQVPLAVLHGEAALEVARDAPSAIVAQSGDTLLCDALHDVAFRDSVVRLISSGETVHGESGSLSGLAGSALPRLLGGALPLPSRVLQVEQSNSSVLYGDGLFVKIVRKLEEGVNPDAEILRFLTERCDFPHAPAFGGMLEFRSAGREGRLIALATSVVPNEGDAWAFTLGELAGFLDRALRAEAAPSSEIFARHSGDSLLRETIGESFLERAAQLGERTGAMHVALASDPSDPEFAPEPLTVADLRELQETNASSLETVLALARDSLPNLDPRPRTELSRLLQAAPALRELAAAAAIEPITAAKTRHHGDYHLGQVLNTGTEFVIIDFEGEPARSLAERRRKRSPLRDVAGMLRSFHYAAYCALRAHPADDEMLIPWAEQWSRLIGAVFLDTWVQSTTGAPFVPENPTHRDRLLSAYLLEKAVYEVGYELNNRPHWVGIPVGGLVRLIRR